MKKQEYSETHTLISPDGKTVTTVTVSRSSSSDTVTSSTSVTTSSSVTVKNTITTNGKGAGNDLAE